ncbi:TPA: EamA family transporter [Klebsiella quasipneumoniae subsp. similipneumoniae]|nr:EamA family transporter [Klebsiella quasipneumoniae subsp. similipneumoniae]
MDYVFPLLAAVLWGANIVITKMASSLISPIEISFLRWFIATLVLTPFVMKHLSRWRANICRQLLRLVQKLTLMLLSALMNVIQ